MAEVTQTIVLYRGKRIFEKARYKYLQFSLRNTVTYIHKSVRGCWNLLNRTYHSRTYHGKGIYVQSLLDCGVLRSIRERQEVIMHHEEGIRSSYKVEMLETRSRQVHHAPLDTHT